jgi:hypothetical protein
MSHTRQREADVAIDPTHLGFGYVIFEGSDRLIDWGVRHVEGDKNKDSIAAVRELISRYRAGVTLTCWHVLPRSALVVVWSG